MLLKYRILNGLRICSALRSPILKYRVLPMAPVALRPQANTLLARLFRLLRPSISKNGSLDLSTFPGLAEEERRLTWFNCVQLSCTVWLKFELKATALVVELISELIFERKIERISCTLLKSIAGLVEDWTDDRQVLRWSIVDVLVENGFSSNSSPGRHRDPNEPSWPLLTGLLSLLEIWSNLELFDENILLPASILIRKIVIRSHWRRALDSATRIWSSNWEHDSESKDDHSKWKFSSSFVNDNCNKINWA